jgi:hypothetical protein
MTSKPDFNGPGRELPNGGDFEVDRVNEVKNKIEESVRKARNRGESR